MKRIYIVRHAKSSWDDLSLQDFDRPLNDRGLKDAPRMSSRCKQLRYVPDLMISSDANRAKTTGEIFHKGLSMASKEILLNSDLYHAPEDTYLEVCHDLDESIRSVMLFGHNPGITYFANAIPQVYIDNVPTCGVLVVDSNATKWSELNFSNCKLLDFLYPKMQ